MAHNIIKGMTSRSELGHENMQGKFKRNLKDSHVDDEFSDRSYFSSKGEKDRESKKAERRRARRDRVQDHDDFNPKY